MKREIHGWLLLDKPVGLGSTQALGKARWALKAKKAGHAGTLDPLASGLLALAFGEATKTIPFAMGGLKTYRFAARWGFETETDDSEGEPRLISEARPSPEAIRAVLPGFHGEIQQKPPAYSAIKIDGERAYDLARAGEAPEMAARPIWIESLTYLEAESAPDLGRFEMTCGKGGYVRSMARDLGRALGCGAYVTELRRLRAGPFALDQAISLESLEALRDNPHALTRLLPVSTGLDDIPVLAVTEAEAAHIRQGRAVPAAGVLSLHDGDKLWASLAGEPVAIGHMEEGRFQPDRVFNLA
ncbi:tRNA pseudouridine(55) synthase TruB [Neomegalonema perideroedes]|uniref:tRNA pseudouridine(55) synthase TruB n=1 Tax=Neomegalonema perideroedes TaxID=217219 RepID=UPI00037F16F5|nr:tRNA pseudouridine(55) synthase TruB [Neomegalonema perideroedes]